MYVNAYLLPSKHNRIAQIPPAGKKFAAVTTTSPTLNNQSPFTYYCSRLEVHESDAVYVYASTTVPFDKKFSKQQKEFFL